MSDPIQFLKNVPLRAVVVTDHEDPTQIRVRRVKNLKWLLLHWSEVDNFEVTECPRGLFEREPWDCILKANLRNGRYYACTWASRNVLWDWLKRPVFYTVKLDWFGVPLVVDERPTKAPPTSSIKSKRTV